MSPLGSKNVYDGQVSPVKLGLPNLGFGFGLIGVKSPEKALIPAVVCGYNRGAMWRYFKQKKDEFVERVFQPIPEEFHSFETGEPFVECIECKAFLDHDNADYIIEKSYQNDEVIYEYALCKGCSDNLRGELSKDSLKHIKKAFRRPVLKTTIEGCRKCGLPRHELPGYTIVGACMGYNMLFWNVPMLICEPCLEEVEAGLSKQTRDVLDDFEERNFPGPPEFELDLPEAKPRRKVVLI